MRIRMILLIATVITLFALLTVGAYVTVAGDGDACGSSVPNDYPLCQGHFLPPPILGAIAEYSHRVLASLSSLFLIITAFLFWRSKDPPVAAKQSLYVASLLIIAEIILGAAVVATIEPPWLVTIHQANALLVFGFAVAALASDRRGLRTVLSSPN
ncbi:MAG TPA: COX15/CtaA family protein [Nitrososphaerales archaeon]|nr:COX15/CtaA family protein [Nitrososphaerales archaeon]